jgi:tetratricopeptide (TPR) repeat protein
MPRPSTPDTWPLPPDQPPGEEPTLALPPTEDDGATVGPAGEAAPAAPVSVPGYEILGELGRGGMGVVYKARHLALDRVMALKMILAGGHAGAAELARFQTEAHAIARLAHPGIVAVYEVGEHEGRPFLSLEYCGGGSLEKRLNGTPLPPREAAALLAKLAEAMHTAHQAGVVHRDLKPANVLLSAACGLAGQLEPGPAKPQAAEPALVGAVPKITDFGLAKRLDEASQTISGAVMGTPSYMAPEQAQGDRAVGPPCDVYALGAILYECLTGRPPFRAATAFDTIVQVIHDEPVPPGRLNAQVPRDLETICLKCLQKDPARRYPGAADLADDLRRFLVGEPIRARPVGALERGLKWMRRRPALAALGAVSILGVLAVLAVGFAFHLRLQRERDYALWQRDQADLARDEAERQRNQARENFRLARQAVDEYAKKAAEDPRLKERGVQQVRQEWLQAAERFYQEFIRQAGDDPEVRLEQARAYSRLAGISAEIGTRAEAEKQYQKALALWQQLLRDYPDRHECRREMAELVAGLSDLDKARGRYGRAEKLLLEALAMHQALVRDYPDNLDYRTALAAAHNNLGLLHKDRRRYDRAERSFRTAIDLAGRLPRTGEKGREVDVLIAMAYINLVGLYQNQEKFARAEEASRQARLAFERRQRAGGLTREHRNALALLLLVRAFLFTKTDRPAPAEKTYHEALALLEPLAEEQPHVADVQHTLGATYMVLGLHYFNLGQPDKAAPLYDKASAIQDRLYRNYPDVKTYRTNRLSGLLALSGLYFVTRQAGPCEASLTKARLAAEELVASHPDEPEMKRKLASIHYQLGKLFTATGRRPQALAEYRQDLALREELVKRYPQSNDFRTELGGGCCDLGQFLRRDQPAQALALYNRAVALLEGVLAGAPEHEQAREFLAITLSSRANALSADRPADALADRRRQRACLEQQVCASPHEAKPRRDLAAVERQVGALLQRLGRLPEAEEAYRREFHLLDDLARGGMLDDDPPASLTALADAAANLAHFLHFEISGRRTRAEPMYRRAIVVRGWLTLTAPDTAGQLVRLGGLVCDLGTLHARGDQPGRSLPWYARAERLLEQALKLAPDNRTAARFLRNVRAGRAAALVRLDRPTEAIAQQVRVVEYHEQVVAAGKATPTQRRELGTALEGLGDLYRDTTQLDRAETAYARATAECEKLRDDRTEGRRARLSLAKLYHERARLQGRVGKFAPAIAFLRRERSLRDALVKAEPDSGEQRDGLARCLGLLASLYLANRQASEAVEAQREAVRHWEKLVRAFPAAPAAQVELAGAYQRLGVCEYMGKDLVQASASLARACAWGERLLGSLPPDAVHAGRRDAARSYALLVQVLVSRAQAPQAERAAGRALELFLRVCRDDPADLESAVEMGGTACNRGLARGARSRWQAARADYDLAVRTLSEVLRRDDKQATARAYLINSLWGRASNARAQKRHQAALADLDRALALGVGGTRGEQMRLERAVDLVRLGRYNQAAAEASSVLAGKAGGTDLYRGACVLALAARAVGRDEGVPLPVRDRQAEAHARAALDLLERARRAGYFGTAERRRHLDRDDDLLVLRPRDDYRAWRRKLDAKPAP